MKRIFSLALIAIMITMGISAYADQGTLDYELFYSAKNAISKISTGDYDSAAAIIGCKKDGLVNFVEGNYSDLSNAQTYVSVAYRNAEIYYIAVPVSEPSDESVPAFVFSSNDGSTFSGLQYMTWGEVERAYIACDYVVWCEEYLSDDMQIIQ